MLLTLRELKHMGLMSLFGRGPLSDKKIAKVAKLAANPFAQPEVRMREMQRLIEDGSDASLRGVLRRFAANAQGHIADEDEKKWLEDALVRRGEEALPALRDYINSEEKLTYALAAFRRIAGDDAATDFLLGVLQHYGPDDHRSGEAKLQIILQLGEYGGDASILPILSPFLNDHSDEVRWSILELLERATTGGTFPPEQQSAYAAELLQLVTSEEVGPRIARRAADILCRLEWSLKESPAELAAVLGDEYFLDKKHFVRRRGKKSQSESA